MIFCSLCERGLAAESVTQARISDTPRLRLYLCKSCWMRGGCDPNWDKMDAKGITQAEAD